MREYKIIAAFTVVLILVVAAYFLHHAFTPGAGDFDEAAYTRIASTCGYKQECKVNLGNLYDGDWDTLWLFGAGTQQAELDAVLPQTTPQPGSNQRLVVLTLNGKIQSRIVEPADQELYLDHQVVFRINQNSEQTLHLPRDSWLWANRTPSRHQTGDSFYILTPDNR